METLGSLIDKLSIINLKIWHAEEVAHNPEASDKEIANAKKNINRLNNMRTGFVEEIDVLFEDVLNKKRPVPKAYRSIIYYHPSEGDGTKK